MDRQIFALFFSHPSRNTLCALSTDQSSQPHYDWLPWRSRTVLYRIYIYLSTRSLLLSISLSSSNNSGPVWSCPQLHTHTSLFLRIVPIANKLIIYEKLVRFIYKMVAAAATGVKCIQEGLRTTVCVSGLETPNPSDEKTRVQLARIIYPMKSFYLCTYYVHGVFTVIIRIFISILTGSKFKQIIQLVVNFAWMCGGGQVGSRHYPSSLTNPSSASILLYDLPFTQV